MVFAVWVTGAQAPEGLVERLVRAKEAGLQAIDDVASEAASSGRTFLTAKALRRYFTKNIDYGLSAEHVEGIERYQELCMKHGLLSDRRRIAFA
jgi:predicted solute-binding protein